MSEENGNPGGGTGPYDQRHDPERDTLYPNLRLKTVYVPCPECNQLLDVVAENHAQPQTVILIQHSDVSDKYCPASGTEYQLPGREGEGDIAYSPKGIPSEIAPNTLKEYPPAPPSDGTVLDRIRDYALACPISALLKLQSEIDIIWTKLADITAVFLPDQVDHDPVYSQVNRLREIIEESLSLRFSVSARAFHAEGGSLSFHDVVNHEYITIPLESIRTRTFRSTTIPPKDIPQAPDDDEDEDEV